MRRLTLTLFACAVAARGLGAQQTRADSLRQQAIRDSIALMQALEAAAARPTPNTGGTQGPTNPRMLPDLSAVGDLVGDFSPKGSTQEANTRLGVREVELAVQAVVDPYFRGDLFLGFSDAEGVHIEQAFMTTTALRDLELRLGRQLMPFGKQNTTHRHDLHTIEYPWVIQRYLGEEGLKGTGLFASKVFAPFGFYQEIIVSAVDRLGEVPDDLLTAEPVNKEVSGLGYTARFRNYVDINQATNFELSASAMNGRVERPLVNAAGELVELVDGVNATPGRQTTLGLDATLRWRPLQQGLYKSFLLQGELMHQINEVNPTVLGIAPSGVLDFQALPGRDFTGGYVYARYQLTRRVFLGGRFDSIEEPLLDGRSLTAGSGYLEWYPTSSRNSRPGTSGSINRALRDRTASCYKRHSRSVRTDHIPSDSIQVGANRRGALRMRARHLLFAAVAVLSMVVRPAPATAQLKVVTSTTDLYDIAKEVGGSLIKASHVSEGYQDPHFVEAKPSFVLQLRDADVWAFVGLDLEIGWMPLLLDGARNPKVRPGGAGYLDVSRAIAVLDVARGNVDRSQGDVHAMGNPHYWLDPENGRRIARSFRDKFIELDRAHAADYTKNEAAFEARLNAAEKEWQPQLALIKGKPIIAYHTSWRYFAEYTGVRIVAFMEPKPGVPPSPTHVMKVINDAKAAGAKVIIQEPFYDRKMSDLVAKQIGGTVLVESPSVGGTKGLDDYIELMKHHINALAAALK